MEKKQKTGVSASTKRKSHFQLLITGVFSVFMAAVFGQFGDEAVDTIGKKIFAEYQTIPPTTFNRIPLILAGIFAGWLLGSFLIRSTERLGRRWERMDDAEKVTWFVGGAVGIGVTTFFISFFNQFTLHKGTIALLVAGCLILFTATTVYALHSMRESLPWYRGKIRARRTGTKILDTNVIIDGRVYDVARAGFIEGQIYVPQFVLEELQYIADSHDPLRRQRGKRGLDILKLMQAEFEIEVGEHDVLAPEQGDGVDSRLVRLAIAIGGDLVTNDHNLNRVATLQEVRVLNINDLALSLRPNVLPQEQLHLQIIREGNQVGQGVGYLEDGTMVIVENGRNSIGEHVNVVVTQVIQTERGKLIFGELPDDDAGPTSRKTTKRA